MLVSRVTDKGDISPLFPFPLVGKTKNTIIKCNPKKNDLVSLKTTLAVFRNDKYPSLVGLSESQNQRFEFLSLCLENVVK